MQTTGDELKTTNAADILDEPDATNILYITNTVQIVNSPNALDIADSPKITFHAITS